MKTPQLFALILITFASGGAVGYWAGSHPVSDQANPVSKEARHQVENHRPDEPLANLPVSEPPLVAGSADKTSRSSTFTPLEKLKVLADLQERNLLKPTLTFLDRKGKLDNSFVSLFALTPHEEDRLQRGIDEVRQKLASLERANAKISRDGSGNLVVAVEAFPEEGGKVYDEMMGVFADALGPERNEVYRKIGAEQFEISLGRFGAAERTYTFGYDQSESPNQPYTFQDKVVQRGPRAGISSRTNNTRFRTFEELVARVGPIVSVLPPEYRREK